MNETIAQAKQAFLESKQRMMQAFDSFPDDRLNWSPSPTARTPLQIVAHSAESVRCLHGMFDSRPFPIPTTAEADVYFREMEQPYNTREKVVALFEANCGAYIQWLDHLEPERLDSLVQMPFNFGSFPISAVLKFQSLHMDSHVPQLEYIQTIYGDRVWH